MAEECSGWKRCGSIFGMGWQMKRMIWIAWIVVILAVVLLITYYSRNRWVTPPTGGNREDHTDLNAPKVIESTEIVEFHCEFSTLTSLESEKLGRGVYELDAVLEENMVSGKYSVHLPGEGEEDSPFEADSSFMTALQELVAEYDLARYNCLSVRVSGLPYFFGARLQVEYASGESIHACHNQSRFLSMEEIEALEALFYEQIEKRTEENESGEG